MASISTREWLVVLDRGELPDLSDHDRKRDLRALRGLGLVDGDNELTERGRDALTLWTQQSADL